MSYQDVRDIALDMVRQNLPEFIREARELIDIRVNDIAERFAQRMKDEAPEVLRSVTDPDVLHAISTAGLTFARSGDDDLGDVLVDLLADRCAAEQRSLMAIVLNEAIATAGRMTRSQMAILSIVWRLTRTKYGRMDSPESFKQYLNEQVKALLEQVPEGEASFWHLQYLGCVSIELTELNLAANFLAAYPGVFSLGFTRDEVDDDLLNAVDSTPLLMPCMRDANRLQVAALDENGIRAHVENLSGKHHAEALIALQNVHLMTPEAVKFWVESELPWAARLFELWPTTPLQNCRLTSVGMAIAHANYRKLTGSNPPLSIWIDESK